MPETAQRAPAAMSMNYPSHAYSQQQSDVGGVPSLPYALYGGADTGECVTTVNRVGVDGTPDDWYREWTATADRIAGIARESERRASRRADGLGHRGSGDALRRDFRRSFEPYVWSRCGWLAIYWSLFVSN